MKAEDFVNQYGGEVVAGDAIAYVNGKKQWATRNGELTAYGLAIVREYKEAEYAPEPVIPHHHRHKKARKQYMPEED